MIEEMESKKSEVLSKLWRKFRNMVWEHKLGVTTRGVVEISEPDAVDYGASSYPAILAILHNLSLKSSDVFVDVGCGKGRVVCCASRFNIQEMIGIEVNENLCEIAQRNAVRLRGRRASITIINARAQGFDYSKGTVFYFFNPFGSLTLNEVLSKLRFSLYSYPRRVKIVYLNPIHESLLSACDWLERYDRWEPRRNIGLEYPVSFWRSAIVDQVGKAE
jgi:precorrin-6B methylase 2